MRSEALKKITGVLHEGKLILDLYESHGYPTEGKKYKEFVYDIIGIGENLKYHHLDMLLTWLHSQEGNNLQYPSSGSTRVALEDFDNFVSGMGGEDYLTEKEHEFALNMYKGLFQY